MFQNIFCKQIFIRDDFISRETLENLVRDDLFWQSSILSNCAILKQCGKDKLATRNIRDGEALTAKIVYTWINILFIHSFDEL